MQLPSLTLTDRESTFVSAYSSGLEGPEAAAKAGCPNPVKDSWLLLRRPRVVAAILIETRRLLVVAAPQALHLLREVVAGRITDGGKARTVVAIQLLDRAGLIPPRSQPIENTGNLQLHEMGIDDLHKLAEQLEGERARRAKPVAQVEQAPASSVQSSQPIDINE